MQNQTQMATEFREAPGIVRRQAEALTHPIAELVAALRRQTPQVIVTCARGSSAHAATFGKHLIERHLGIPVSAVAPNIATVYRRRLHLKGQMFLAISQAGRSDDIVESVALAREAGALTAALVNDTESPLATASDVVESVALAREAGALFATVVEATESPLAKASDVVLPMLAGPEVSVAATKTCVASLAVLLRLAAMWTDDGAIR